MPSEGELAQGSIDSLVSVASPAESQESVPFGHALESLLGKRNGFYAFLSALHVFPHGGTAGGRSIEDWNRQDSWRRSYPDLDPGTTAFAEDLFGNQFLIGARGVQIFDPETAEIEDLCGSIPEWCEAILSDTEYLTGFPLAQEWQDANGPIPRGMRLVPVTPFVLGGDFACENLMLMDALKGMSYRADLAEKIRNVPDGEKIVLKID